jgi:hypothetical protein
MSHILEDMTVYWHCGVSKVRVSRSSKCVSPSFPLSDPSDLLAPPEKVPNPTPAHKNVGEDMFSGMEKVLG